MSNQETSTVTTAKGGGPLTSREPKPRRGLGIRAMRASDTFYDAMGVRPIGFFVFVASVLLFGQLLGVSSSSVRADSVAVARVVDHPSRVASFTTEVFVKLGDRVAVGSPLVQLSSYFIDEELAQLSGEIEMLLSESQLAKARLFVDEDRWLDSSLRQKNRPSLEDPTAAYYAKQLELLQERKAALLARRDALTIHSTFDGVVTEVAWPGASIAEGASVASVMPDFAEEIVAYVPAATNPAMISDDAMAYIVGADFEECRAPGRIQRRGAAVVEAPDQLRNLFRDPLHGLPVFVSIPDDCKLGIGQTLTLDFRLEARG